MRAAVGVRKSNAEKREGALAETEGANGGQALARAEDSFFFPDQLLPFGRKKIKKYEPIHAADGSGAHTAITPPLPLQHCLPTYGLSTYGLPIYS